MLKNFTKAGKMKLRDIVGTARKDVLNPLVLTNDTEFNKMLEARKERKFRVSFVNARFNQQNEIIVGERSGYEAGMKKTETFNPRAAARIIGARNIMSGLNGCVVMECSENELERFKDACPIPCIAVQVK